MAKRRGFTLIELLLVTGIIGVLAGVTIIAVNPARQLAQARNAMRRSDVHTIANALSQYTIDHSGEYPAPVTTMLSMIGTASGGCAVSCSSLGGNSEVTTVTLYPSADATIQENAATTNYGTTPDLQEYPWEPNWSRRFLIQFDLSTIPANATITGALLYLRESGTYGSTRTVGAYSITRNWTEGGVTWNKTDGSTNWTTAGGDFAASAFSTTTPSWTGILDWDIWNVQSDVQAFVDGSQQNFGWLLKDTNENNSQAYWFFHSKEEATSGDNQPYLEVRYTTAEESATTSGSCINLSSDLAPTYLSSVPDDPSLGTQAQTYYATQIDSLQRLLVRACAAELGETIDVQR